MTTSDEKLLIQDIRHKVISQRLKISMQKREIYRKSRLISDLVHGSLFAGRPVCSKPSLHSNLLPASKLMKNKKFIVTAFHCSFSSGMCESSFFMYILILSEDPKFSWRNWQRLQENSPHCGAPQ